MTSFNLHNNLDVVDTLPCIGQMREMRPIAAKTSRGSASDPAECQAPGYWMAEPELTMP